MTENNKTIWKVCPIADFFEVSTMGDIRLVGRTRIKKPCDNGNGYLYVAKVIDKKAKHYYVHQLVAATFINNPDNLTEINHKDGNKANNSVENLEWCTRSENLCHAYRTGLIKITDKQREARRKNVYKSYSARKEGWEKWYATEEGRRKCVEHAKTNLEAIKQKKCAST